MDRKIKEGGGGHDFSLFISKKLIPWLFLGGMGQGWGLERDGRARCVERNSKLGLSCSKTKSLLFTILFRRTRSDNCPTTGMYHMPLFLAPLS